MSTPTAPAAPPELALDPGEIAAWRAFSQGLWGERPATPMEVFEQLGAVQSQEIHSSKLTPAMRAGPEADGSYTPVESVDALIEDGSVVRTHVLRPTWHTVPVGKLRMMLAATADRVGRALASMTRGRGLSEDTLARCDQALADATAGGRHLTREEAHSALVDAGVPEPTNQQMIYILMHAELAGAICSGTPRGRQQTYANFDERVPARTVDREEAIRELACCFFASRGPATLKDFSRWASLKAADAQAAITGLELNAARIDGRVCYFADEPPPPRDGGPRVDFVQGWDEMLCSYTDSKDWVLHASVPRADFPARPRFNSVILLDGQVIGYWKATLTKRRVEFATYRLRGFTAAEIAAMRRGADRLRRWYGREEMELGLERAR